MFRRIIFLFFCFSLTSTLSFRLFGLPIKKQAESATKILSEKELEALQKEIKFSDSIHVQFVQNTYKNLRKKTISTKGEAYFKKPNKFQWILKDEVWIFDGKIFVQHQPAKKTAVSYSKGVSKNKELQELVDMVLDFKSLLMRYNVVEAAKDTKKLRIKLSPKLASDITSADVDVDVEKNYVTQVELSFNGGNKTTFVFNSPDFKSIPDSRFTLPKETKVSEGI